MLDLRKLVMLREVRLGGSIAAAARALSYTRSAVSQQLSALEAEVGMPLLVRHGGQARLTPAGEDLVQRTERILIELRAAEAALASRKGQVEGVLRIGIPFREGPPMVGDALTEIRHRYPLLAVELRSVLADAAVDAVRRGQLDLALMTHYGAPRTSTGPDLHVYELGHDLVRAVVPASHSLAGATSCALRELADEPWVIGMSTDLGALTISLCRRFGVEPRVVASADNLDVALRLVGSEWGVTLAPELAPLPGGVARLDLTDVTVRRTTLILVRAGDESSPTIAAAMTAITEHSRSSLPAV